MKINNFVSLEEVDSTNKYIKENLNVLKSGSIVMAKKQTNGHGRKSRVWSSEENKSLTFSLLVKHHLRHDLGLITQVAAVSIVSALKDYHINALIKWPNDIILNNKKTCGILVENVIYENAVSVVIGIGLNVNNTEFNDDISSKATSLFLETKETYDLLTLLKKIVDKLEYYYNQYMNNSNNDFLNIARQNSYLIGKEILLENKSDKAIVKDIDSLGRLVVLIHGEERICSDNEVSLSNYYRSS